MKVLDFILILLIVICASYITYFFTVSTINDCTSNPLDYHLKELKEKWLFPDTSCENMIRFYEKEIDNCLLNRTKK